MKKRIVIFLSLLMLCAPVFCYSAQSTLDEVIDDSLDGNAGDSTGEDWRLTTFANWVKSNLNFTELYGRTDPVIGTNVQAYSAVLDTYTGIAPSANMQAILAAANYAAMRTLFDLEVGVDFNAYDANLPTWPSTVDATEVGYLNGVSGAIQAQIDAKLANVVEDTTPQAGGNYDLNGKYLFDATGVDDDDCTGDQGKGWWDSTDNQWEFCNANTGTPLTISTGSGDVSGPASSVDNTLVIFDSTTGKLIKSGTGCTIAAGTLTCTDIVITNSADLPATVDFPDNSVDLADMTDSSVGSAEITDLAIVNADVNASAAISVSKTALVAGRSLALSTDTLNADAELYTHTECIYIEDPDADDDLQSIWRPKGYGVTLTSIWAESDQTVNLDLQVDDGTPADVNGTDLVPAAGTAEDTSLSGDTSMADGDRIDLAVTSVSGTPTWVSICWTYTKGD